MYIIIDIIIIIRSYLTNKIQCISITRDLETDTKNICCEFPQGSILGDTKNICCEFHQGSILGPLLFLLYVNDLRNSKALELIMFANYTNLFYEHNDLKTLFSLVSKELQKNNEWFEANKLSLNVEKTNYYLFHKPSRRDDLPLLLPKLLINKHKVERVESTKFC